MDGSLEGLTRADKGSIEQVSEAGIFSSVDTITSRDESAAQRGMEDLVRQIGSAMHLSRDRIQKLLSQLSNRANRSGREKMDDEMTQVIAAVEGIASRNPSSAARGLTETMRRIGDSLRWPSGKISNLITKTAQRVSENRSFNWKTLRGDWLADGRRRFWDTIKTSFTTLAPQTPIRQPLPIKP